MGLQGRFGDWKFRLQSASSGSSLELQRKSVLRLFEGQNEPHFRPSSEPGDLRVESARWDEVFEDDVAGRPAPCHHHRLQSLLAARVEDVGPAKSREAFEPRRVGPVVGHSPSLLRPRHEHAVLGGQGRREHPLLRGDGLLALPALAVLLHRVSARTGCADASLLGSLHAAEEGVRRESMRSGSDHEADQQRRCGAAPLHRPSQVRGLSARCVSAHVCRHSCSLERGMALREEQLPYTDGTNGRLG